MVFTSFCSDKLSIGFVTSWDFFYPSHMRQVVQIPWGSGLKFLAGMKVGNSLQLNKCLWFPPQIKHFDFGLSVLLLLAVVLLIELFGGKGLVFGVANLFILRQEILSSI